MANEPNKPTDDAQSILSDLDALLAAPPAADAPIPPALGITLAPREGSAPPSKKPEPSKPEPPKPRASDAKPPLEINLEAAKPAPPRPDVLVSAPAIALAPIAAPAAPPEPPAASATAIDEVPPDAPASQIRWAAYVYTPSCIETRATFAAFLTQAARTLSKTPLFLREATAIEVGAASDPNAVYEKAREAKAVIVFAVVDGWPSAKIDGLAAACARGGLLFRVVAPADAEKRSVAVDAIVDMLLLPG